MAVGLQKPKGVVPSNGLGMWVTRSEGRPALQIVVNEEEVAPIWSSGAMLTRAPRTGQLFREMASTATSKTFTWPRAKAERVGAYLATLS